MVMLLFILIIVSIVFIYRLYLQGSYLNMDIDIMISKLINEVDKFMFDKNITSIETYKQSYNLLNNNLNHLLYLYYKEHYNENFEISKIKINNGYFICEMKSGVINYYVPASFTDFIKIYFKIKYLKLTDKVVKQIIKGN